MVHIDVMMVIMCYRIVKNKLPYMYYMFTGVNHPIILYCQRHANIKEHFTDENEVSISSCSHSSGKGPLAVVRAGIREGGPPDPQH